MAISISGIIFCLCKLFSAENQILQLSDRVYLKITFFIWKIKRHKFSHENVQNSWVWGAYLTKYLMGVWGPREIYGPISMENFGHIFKDFLEFSLNWIWSNRGILWQNMCQFVIFLKTRPMSRAFFVKTRPMSRAFISKKWPYYMTSIYLCGYS